jgi:transcription-repair coupling factor (superfamily II helicase)
MDVYKQIAEITGEKDLKEIATTLSDTFGKLPEEVLNLLDIAFVKRLAINLKVKEIVVKKGETYLEFEEFSHLNNPKLLTAMDCFGSRVKLSVSDKPRLEFNTAYSNNVQMLGVLKEFLLLATE